MVVYFCWLNFENTPEYVQKEIKLSEVLVSRILVSFAWVYHGLVPKLLHIAPLEYQMSSNLGFNHETTYILIKLAGISEIILGCLVWWQYKNKLVIASSIIGLLALIIAVAALTPHLIVEAFNPITTNLPLIGLSFILWHNANDNDNKKSL